MANKRIQKKWEKQGGRKAGVPNLVKTGRDTLVNQHGVTFTTQEKRALESAVNSANRKRARMLKEEAALPRMSAGKNTGQTVGELHKMGKESDFIITKKTKSLQRFKTKEEFTRYLENLRIINDRNFIDKRTEMYKENYIKGLENVFGDDAKDIIEKVKGMKGKEYRQFVQSDEDREIGFIYSAEDYHGRLNVIRATFGLRQHEEPITEV